MADITTQIDDSIKCVGAHNTTCINGSHDDTVDTSWLNELTAHKHHQDEMKSQKQKAPRPARKKHK
jgi:hypothetical protein